MIEIKGIEMPKGCQRCKFFKKHPFGNGLDYSYSCMLGATEFPMPWIRQMEERASDCPLAEIEEPTTGHWIVGFGGCKCSECGCTEAGFSDFCPNCGAEMEVEE